MTDEMLSPEAVEIIKSSFREKETITVCFHYILFLFL